MSTPYESDEISGDQGAPGYGGESANTGGERQSYGRGEPGGAYDGGRPSENESYGNISGNGFGDESGGDVEGRHRGSESSGYGDQPDGY